MTAEHSGRAEQPIGQVARNASTQQSDCHSPGWMTDSRYQLDDHKGKHEDPGNREHVSEALALAEGGAGVADEPQCEQSAQQPDRGKRLELSHCNDLGDKISC